MKTMKVVTINTVDYAPFGTFYDMEHPSGCPLSGELHIFHPNTITESLHY